MEKKDLNTIKFRLIAEVINFPGGIEEVVAHQEVEEDCIDDCEAIHLARDLAWDLYGEVEDSRIELPSFNSLLEMYRGEWFDLSERDFDRAIDDLYVRTVNEHIDYWVEEVK